MLTLLTADLGSMDTDTLFFAMFSFLLVAVGIAAHYVWTRFLRSIFPLGPPGLPILGDVFDTLTCYRTVGQPVTYNRFGKK